MFAVSERPQSTGHLVELQACPALFRVSVWSEVALAPVALEALRVLASSWPLPGVEGKCFCEFNYFF
jgi:hypothetical protein